MNPPWSRTSQSGVSSTAPVPARGLLYRLTQLDRLDRIGEGDVFDGRVTGGAEPQVEVQTKRPIGEVELVEAARTHTDARHVRPIEDAVGHDDLGVLLQPLALVGRQDVAVHLELLEVQESDFPDGKTLWHGEPPYLGEGPHLGQKGKYEILILPSAGASKSFLLDQFGLSLKTSVRYNVPDRDSLILVTHTRQGSLTRDAALHGHVVFNLTHNLIDGYKHYSYDTPIWLHEGLAHYLERELNPEYNSFDSGEGATAEKTSKSNWTLPTRKLVQRDDAPSMAQLMALRSYADLELEHHFSSWSRVEYLLQEHPGFLARLLAALKGRTDAAGLADGSGVADAQREVFRDELGMSYAQFDRAWADWVLSSD